MAEVSDFTLATMNISAELQRMKEESTGTAPLFMHERGSDPRTRRKNFQNMTEFERLMEIQTNGLNNVLHNVGGNGRTI
jgi:hypothetical protein